MPLLRVYKKKESHGVCWALPPQAVNLRAPKHMAHAPFSKRRPVARSKEPAGGIPPLHNRRLCFENPQWLITSYGQYCISLSSRQYPLQDERSPTESASDLPSTPVTLSDVPEKADHDKPVTDPALLLPALHWQPMRPASAMPSFTPAWADEDTRPLFKRPAVPECTSTITAKPACRQDIMNTIIQA